MTRTTRQTSTTSPIIYSVLVVGATVCALALRYWGLGDKSLWLDEIWSVTVAHMSWHALLWSVVNQDPNMSLYHVLLHLWLPFANGEAMIRGLSAAAGAATVPVVYLTGQRLFDRRAGLLASLLMAVNLFHIQYSQEARSYGLWVLLCAASTFFFICCIEESRPADWAWYCATAVLATYAHIYALLLIVSQLASVLMLDTRHARTKAVLASAATIELFSAPLLFLIYLRLKLPFIQLNWVPRLSLRRVYDVFYALSGNADFYGIDVIKLQSGKLLLIICIACTLIVFFEGIQILKRSARSIESWHWVFPFFCLAGPIVLCLCISLRMPLFLNRYMLLCVPPLCILTAQGILCINRRWLSLSLLGTILVCETAALMQYFQYRSQYGEWRTATREILSDHLPGDAIVFSMAHGRLLFDFYRNQQQPWSTDIDEVYPDLSRATSDPQALSYYPEPAAVQLAELARHERVWLIVYPDNMAGDAATSLRFQRLLSAEFPKVEVKKIDTIRVCLYSRQRKASSSLSSRHECP